MFSRSTISQLTRSIFTALLMLCLSFTVVANNGIEDKGLSKEEAAADLNFYFKLIDKQHGNPYLYISRDDFQNLIQQKIEALPAQVSAQELTALLIELNQQIRCGHTSVTFDKMQFRAEENRSEFFPYPVAIIDEALYIDFEDGVLPHASKIESINGIPAAQVLSELSMMPVTDGFIETKVKRSIEKRFGHYFFLKYGFYSTFQVVVEDTNGEQLEATVEGVPAAQMLTNNYYRPVYKTNERYIHFTHLDAIDSLHTLVLTLNTFNAHPEWFYKRIMSHYDEESEKFNFDNLVIDLRINEGGDRRLLNILYQLVAGKSLSDPSINAARSLQIEGDQLFAINGAVGEEAIHNAENYLSERFINTSEGGFEMPQHDWYPEEFKLDLDLSKLKFEGQVYVLTSGNTFSAAADLARILSMLDNVTLIGEETGGAHESRTANMILNYKLPNTSMQVQVPVIYEKFVNTNANNGKGRGTFPDHLVSQTREDLINRIDAAYALALDLIKQGQQTQSFGSE